MNNKTDIDVRYVSPLKKICMTIGELPASYLETMSYYEMLVWFTEFLKNTIIPTVNNNAEAVSELQALYEELRTYVNDYFDNLDVQDEINNKLEAMAESGQLTDIIAQYLGLAGMIAFDTVADMKQATNLVNGSKCRTLGYYTANDGGGAYYKIRTVTNDDVVDDQYIIKVYDNLLVAELIIDKPIDIRCLGIKGDGNSNSSTLMSALTKNDSFIFKDGEYVFSQLTLSNKDNYNLYGENATLSGASSFAFNGSSNIVIKGLKFDQNTSNALIFTDCENVNVENNEFTNSETATIRIIRTTGNTCKNLKFINNNFISVSKTNTWGGAIYVDGQGKNSSEDTTATLPIEQVEIRGNLFEDIGTGGVNFGGVKDAIIDSNIFKNSYGTQNMLMTCTRESKNLVISNNTFSGCGWECCILNYCSNSTISGNYFEDFGYGVSIEDSSSDIAISNNVCNGMKNNRTHTGSGLQSNTYGIIIKDSSNININDNNIKDCTNNIYLGTNLNLISVSNNLLTEGNNGIAYGGTNGNHDNIIYYNNTIKNCNNGISIGTHGNASVIGNKISSTNYGIGLDQLSADSNIVIDNNYIDSAIGINEANVYNIDCHQSITNNKIYATNTIINKTSWGTNIGYILWNNPDVTLNETHLSTKFVKGSIIKYNHTDFTTKPTEAASAGIGYFMQNVENGVVFIMSDGVWKRKTGGGGSVNITTTDW